MTQYFISPGFATNAKEISFAQYTQLSDAIDRTKTLFRIEGHFQILAQEYFDFEELIARLALRTMYKMRDETLSAFFDDASAEITAKLAAFLSLSRSYEEQTKQKLNGQRSIGFSAKEFAALLSQEYDQYLEYQIGYSLRNDLAHESFLGVTLATERSTPSQILGQQGSKALFEPGTLFHRSFALQTWSMPPR